jgi:beta-glucosidase-like glycosyl hydrolase
MTKQVHFPSEAEQAAVASGVDLTAVPHEEVEVPEVPEVEAKAEAPVPTPEPESAAAYLTAELKAVRGELDELKIKLAMAEQERTKLAAAEELLAPIVREATNKLQIALRQTPTTLAGLPAAVLAAQYAEIKAQFEKVMPVGAHARSETDTSREPQDAGEQRLFLIK